MRKMLLPKLHAFALLALFALCLPAHAQTAHDKELIRQAISEIEVGTHAEIFEHFLKLRDPELGPDAVAHYFDELTKRKELAHTKILGPKTKEAAAVRKSIRPVLDQFRRNGVAVVVLVQDTPFIGLYRECILLFSTKLLEMLPPDELRAAAAHELSHEPFIPELREADRASDTALRHRIELKSDLVAAVGLIAIKDDPLALARAVARIEKFYEQYDESQVEKSDHPRAALRKDCLKQFLSHSTQTAKTASK
ncbi:MAG: hypothetical protein LC800_06405 [Acidobacteria bacterium]|nr:hypothetical protein [Acidobacteriota bacterium]